MVGEYEYQQASAASSVWLLLVTYCCYLSPLSLFCCMHATSSSERDRERGVCVCSVLRYTLRHPAWFAALLPQRCLVNLSDASLLCFPSPATSHVARSYLAQACRCPCMHRRRRSPLASSSFPRRHLSRSQQGLFPACLFAHICSKNQNYVLIAKGMHVVKKNPPRTLFLSFFLSLPAS